MSQGGYLKDADPWHRRASITVDSICTWYGSTASVSSNIYSVLSLIPIDSVPGGTRIRCIAGGTNTGSATLKVVQSNTGATLVAAQTIYRSDHVTTLSAGDIRSGYPFVVEKIDGSDGYMLMESTGTVNSILGDVESGTYTPTTTNGTNVSASSAQLCLYQRIGNIVHVAGAVSSDAVATGAADIGISLPIASNFALFTDCFGTVYADSVAQGGAIYADATNNRMKLNYIAASTANVDYLIFTAMYQIIT